MNDDDFKYYDAEEEMYILEERCLLMIKYIRSKGLGKDFETWTKLKEIEKALDDA